MTIEEKIKEAFKKDKLLKEASKWDPETHPNIYELSNFLRKSGYKLVDIIPQNTELLIEPVEKTYMYPEILHDVPTKSFHIKVVEHGFLVSSDVESVISGYENALGVVRHLEALDLDKLEIEEE